MRLFAGVATVVALFLVKAPSLGADVCVGDISELIDFGKLAYLRDSVCTQVSSFDRSGGNDDGFSGKSSYLRLEDGNQVIFDADGPGCIYRIWAANPNDKRLEFFFDGADTPGLVFDSFQDMFQDKVYPFLSPVSQHFIGGWCSYVPIPFRRHLKIVSHGGTKFLQITWHKFASPNGVESFSTDFPDRYREQFDAVRKVWSNPGAAPWGDRAPPAWQTHDVRATVAAGRRSSLLRLGGAGMVRALYLTMDGADVELYRKCVLQVTADSARQPNVYCPIGDFFLDGFGWPPGRSVLIGMAGDEWYSYWPMPFARGLDIALVNDSAGPVRLRGRVIVEPLESLPPTMGRFYAWWHRENPTRMGRGFEMLTATGRGHFCGVNHYMQGTCGGVGFLEGDEKIWVDDRDNTYYNGTGTEDYFNGGWYFGATGMAPLYGCPVLDDAGGTVDAYRLQVTDLVPFRNRIHAEIEHGSHNNYPIDCSGVTFWYAEPKTVHTFQPAPVEERRKAPRKDQRPDEVERGFLGGGPFVQIEWNQRHLRYSDDALVRCYAKYPGGLIKCRFDFDATSRYEIRAQVLCGPTFGRVQALIDGRPVGEPVDCYSEVEELKVRLFAASTLEIHAGVHTIGFKVVGKSDRAKAFDEGVDIVYLRRLGLIEGEALKQLAGAPEVERQLMGPVGGDWSNDAQVVLEGGNESWYEFELPVSARGRYNVGAYFMTGPDSGKLRLTLDGRVVADEVDLYADTVHRADMMRYGGEYDLAAGTHKLRIDVTGKNDDSRGYLVGLDAMSLEPVAQ